MSEQPGEEPPAKPPLPAAKRRGRRAPRSRIRRWLSRLGWFALGLVGTGAYFGCCVFSAPRYEGPRSDHFDGENFVNQIDSRHSGFWELLKWQSNRDQGSWSEHPDARPGPKPPERVGRGELRVTFVGHATVLIQTDGKNILTDPIWSARCSPVAFAGPRRVRPAAIAFTDLPPIDAVVISHNHYDHLDLPTLRQLQQAHEPQFYVGLGNAALLQEEGISKVTELDWWQSVELDSGLKLHSVPARHFSGRGLRDRDGTLWTGWLLRGPAGVTYFAGDTGFGPHFAQIRERFGPPRLAILPIGAYLPRWFMQQVHVSPAEAVQAHQVLGAGRSLAMHFGTFPLADDGELDPPKHLREALTAAGIADDRFWVLGFGEGRDVPPAAAAEGG